jgi:hypothetical protein
LKKSLSFRFRSQNGLREPLSLDIFLHTISS